MTLLMVVAAVLSQSFDVAPQEVQVDVRTMERTIPYLKKDATAEIALSDVRLERTAWNGGTQDGPYFK